MKEIRAKATLFVLLLLASTVCVSYLLTIRILNDHVRGEIVKRAESLSRSIASSAGYNLVPKDLLALDNLVFKIKESNPDITSIAILGPDRTVVVHSEAGRAGSRLAPAAGRVVAAGAGGTDIRERIDPGDTSFAVESRIVFMAKDLGSVLLDVDWSVLSGAQSEARAKVLPVFAAILVLGVVSSIGLSSRLTRPVKELASGVEELKSGRRSKPLRVYSEDELGRLTASFNEMTELITGQREKLGQYAHELEDAYISTVRVLGAAIEARDHYTLGHSTRVAGYAVGLARALGLGDDKVEEIEIACLFHDVGKIRIPDAILHKKGRLSPREFEEMRRHSEYGAEILSKAQSLFKYIPAVRHHHEWHDGSGYPDGLSRDAIPDEAAIISLADAYDAMTSDRPYRQALTRERALDIIGESAGKQFHPEFARVFLDLNKPKGPAVTAEAKQQRLAS
ncbi:MAG: HD domain-containing phosphohydrolase [Candidatus Aminicenantes bacterium RBG_16_66_30]